MYDERMRAEVDAGFPSFTVAGEAATEGALAADSAG
jgi:hypothetical protein